jgi:hypothetical protein
MIATIISYPNLIINESIDLGTSLNSAELVQNLCVNVSEAIGEQYIEVTYNGEVITLLITNECRYTPIDIFYQNKEGAIASFTFMKKSVQGIDITTEQFESDRGQPINGFHQYTTYNVQAKSKFNVNTGFINEENNEPIKQMLLSERLWMIQNDLLTPLTIESRTLEFKTRANDRLINYNIQFAYAFNEVNNV